MVRERGELHLPGHNYTGPYTQYKKRKARGDKPINRVDALSMAHDKVYDEQPNDELAILRADANYVLGNAIIVVDASATNRERAEAAFVGTIIGIKTVVGLNLLILRPLR